VEPKNQAGPWMSYIHALALFMAGTLSVRSVMCGEIGGNIITRFKKQHITNKKSSIKPSSIRHFICETCPSSPTRFASRELRAKPGDRQKAEQPACSGTHRRHSSNLHRPLSLSGVEVSSPCQDGVYGAPGHILRLRAKIIPAINAS